MELVEKLKKTYVMSMFSTRDSLYSTLNAERREAAEEIERLKLLLEQSEKRLDWIAQNCVAIDPKMDGNHVWYWRSRPLSGITFIDALENKMKE